MTLEQRARNAGTHLRRQLTAIEPPDATAIPRRSRRGRVATGIAALAVLALAGTGVALARHEGAEPSSLEVVTDREVVTNTQEPVPANGWVAFTSQEGLGGLGDSDVYLVRDGEAPRRIAGTDTDSTAQYCPAFSPDGRRLAFEQVTLVSRNEHAGDGELVVTDVATDGSTSGTITISVEDLPTPACGLVWSPDGRWVAFGADVGVRIVDAATGEQRLLADYTATDLEWRPGTGHLAIADDGIDLYSVTTGETQSLDVGPATTFTWSPDGTRVAFTLPPRGGEANGGVWSDNASLWLANADGTRKRSLDDGYQVLQGIGPVWSPDGHSVVYNRTTGGGEPSEAVVVAVEGTDDRFGTETVIRYPMTPGPDGPVSWNNPRSVTWSPDGSTLLYVAWNDGCYDRSSENCAAQGGSSFAGLLAVPIGSPATPSILADPSWNLGSASWGRQPAD